MSHLPIPVQLSNALGEIARLQAENSTLRTHLSTATAGRVNPDEVLRAVADHQQAAANLKTQADDSATRLNASIASAADARAAVVVASLAGQGFGQLRAMAENAAPGDQLALATRDLAVAIVREASQRAAEMASQAGVPPVAGESRDSTFQEATETAEIARLQEQAIASSDPSEKGRIAAQILQLKHRQASREKAQSKQ